MGFMKLSDDWISQVVGPDNRTVEDELLSLAPKW